MALAEAKHFNNEPTGKCFITNNIKRKRHAVDFIIDSAAASHYTNEYNSLKRLKLMTRPTVVTSAKRGEGGMLSIWQQGQLPIYTTHGNLITIDSVLYSKELSANLLLLQKFARRGAYFVGDDEVLEIKDKITDEIITKGYFKEPFWHTTLKIREEVDLNAPVYLTETEASDTAKCAATDSVNNKVNDSKESLRDNLRLLWHKRLGHVSLGYLNAYKTKMPFFKEY